MPSVNYVETKAEEVLRTTLDSACYSDLFGGAVKEGATDIYLFQPTESFAIDLELVQPWVDYVNKLGFPCEYLGNEFNKFEIPAGWHTFRIDLSKYKYKNHLCSTLSLLRYTFEKGYRGCEYHKGILAFFEIRKTLPKLSLFTALQMSFTFFTGNNHTCHDGSFRRKLVKKKQVFDAFAARNGIYELGSDLFGSWEVGERINFQPTNDYKKLFDIMKGKAKKAVYVVGRAVKYANWLPDFELTDKMEGADLVLFTGGEDVDPSLYNEPAHPTTGSNLHRDNAEKQLYYRAKDLGIKCLGICRGSQFLCVMNGGKLVQDQPGLGYIHPIETIYGPIHITSTHHQAAYPYNLYRYDYDVLGWTDHKLPYHKDGNDQELNPPKECEIVLYKHPNQGNDLGIQGHPEYDDYKDHPDYESSIGTLRKLFNNFITGQL